MEDKAKIVAMLAEKAGKPSQDEPEDLDSHDDEDIGKMACAEDMMAAFNNNDAAAFMRALEDYLSHR